VNQGGQAFNSSDGSLVTIYGQVTADGHSLRQARRVKKSAISSGNRLVSGMHLTEVKIPKGERNMHEEHREAAKLHELAAQAHRTAAEHNEKGDDAGGKWHAERALEYSDHAYKLAKEAHNKSAKIEAL
jgi:hypothetical protein